MIQYAKYFKTFLIEFITGLRYLSIKKNVFSTSFDKRVLVSYLVKPWNVLSYDHANNLELICIARSFNELGFQVDLIHYQNKIFNDYSNYNVIFGFGHPFENCILSTEAKKTLKVLYATGANPLWSMKQSFERLYAFYNKVHIVKKEYLRDGGNEFLLQYYLAHKIILVGNDYIKNTYFTKIHNDIQTISGVVFNKNIDVDYSLKAKRKYLWFGSSGIVHKGLDLILDSFMQRPNLELHVCGTIDQRFQASYNEVLLCHNNIHFHGFISINSNFFKQLMETCSFVISASVSEGMSTSVLTCMVNGGLIPIITLSTGIDINENFIQIESCKEEALLDAIDKSQSLDLQEIISVSKIIKDETKVKYSETTFINKFKSIILNYERSC
ncbi:MAG: glycosyltransferase [Melioribacteraceae bacterium]